MMKYILISFLFLAGSSPVFGQTNIKEAYFHELKGMEDSSGVTNLFYRMFKESEYFCDQGGNDRYLKSTRNDIYHFDTSVKSDSILFRDHFEEWCTEGGMSIGEHVNSYFFINNKINKWIIGETYIATDPTSGLISYNSFENDKYISLGLNKPQRIYHTSSSDSILVGFPSYVNKSVILPSNSEKWPDFFDLFDEIPDSVFFIDKNVVAISPYSDSVYFATTTPNLYKSTDYGDSYTLIDSSKTWDFDNQLYFDKDSAHIYAIAPNGIIRSDQHGEPGSWKLQEIQYLSKGEKFLSINPTVSGSLFVSDSTSILFSENYGDSFSELLSVEYKITGLYKEPDSNLLYVLTTDELLEVNTKTKATTSLKQLPVSNEPEPDVPNQITLDQNYPNPFNPSTMISYQLTGNSVVRLEVFDVTGRKVAVLVDEVPKTAGNHRVNFDASSLASGIYFYRLTTSGQALTRKMLLLK